MLLYLPWHHQIMMDLMCAHFSNYRIWKVVQVCVLPRGHQCHVPVNKLDSTLLYTLSLHLHILTFISYDRWSHSPWSDECPSSWCRGSHAKVQYNVQACFTFHTLLKCFMGAIDSHQYIPGVMVGIILGWFPDLEEFYHDRVDNKDYIVVHCQCHAL